MLSIDYTIIMYKTSITHQQGVTLVEVLVSVLILSLGMLGLASLQALTLKSQQGSWARAAATVITQDFAERVRSNPGATNPAVSPQPYLYTATWASQQSNKPTLTSLCQTQICNTTQLADEDKNNLRVSVLGQLPGAGLYVTGLPNNTYSVTVMWFDKDYLDIDRKTLITSPQCSANPPTLPGSLADVSIARFCCPADSGAVAGVRCVNTAVMP
jgi:type IV pilus assembly protein PilV